MSVASIRDSRCSVVRQAACAVAVGVVLLCTPHGFGQEESDPPPRPAKVLPEAGIAWKSFHPAAFRRAFSENRLILLVLEVPWSEPVAKAHREVWSDPAVIEIVRRDFIAIRERADLRPDLKSRYPAEGWPGVSILLPDGTPLVYQGPGEESGRRVTAGLLPASRMVTLLEMAVNYVGASRATALAASRELVEKMETTSKPEAGAIQEPMVWGIGTSLHGTFDPERRYFGGPPRIPRFDLIELMLVLSAERESPYRSIGLAALDTLTTKLLDEADGGLCRMAVGLDWEDRQQEKLLDRNARLVDLLTLAFRITGRRNYREQALTTAAFLTERLSLEGGVFGSAVCSSCPGGRDETVLTAANAAAASALIRAGAALGDEALEERGMKVARFLKEHRYRPGRLVPRAVVDGLAQPAGNYSLEDQVMVARAFLTAFEASGDPAWRDAAVDLAATTLANMREPGIGALADLIPQRQGPPPLRFGLFPQSTNSDLVRVLVRLFYLTDDRRFRNAARDILRAFAGSYRGSGLQLPAYGLAAYEYHFPPMIANIVTGSGQESASDLRDAALGAPFPFVVVRTWHSDREAEAIRALGFTIASDTGFYAFQAGLASSRQTDPGGVAAVINDVRTRVVEQAAAGEAKAREKDEDTSIERKLRRGGGS